MARLRGRVALARWGSLFITNIEHYIAIESRGVGRRGASWIELTPSQACKLAATLVAFAKQAEVER